MKAKSEDACQAGREAEYYVPLADGAVECRLCPHLCQIATGKAGRCRSRVNREGRLWADAYGAVCALQADPVEKKPLLHFHPGRKCFSLAAAGCNLSCRNCQNWGISQAAPSEVDGRRLLPEEVVGMAVACACPMVAYTYTEPLTYLEYTRDCAKACHEAGLKNVLVTAGYVNPEPLADLLPWLDAANVDLKSFSDEAYRSVCRARLAPVLSTLERMREAGVWVEITNLLIPGVNDDEGMVRQMCRWLAGHGFADRPLHFSRFFPQYRMQDLPPTPVDTLLRARDVARECGLNYVYLGNVDLEGAEDTRCPHCGRTVIRRRRYRVDMPEGFQGYCPECGTRMAGIFV